MTAMRARPVPRLRFSTATRTRAAFRPFHCRFPRNPDGVPPTHVSSILAPSMAFLGASIVVAIIKPPPLAERPAHGSERMRPSSQAGLAKAGIIHSRKRRWNLFPEKKVHERDGD